MAEKTKNKKPIWKRFWFWLLIILVAIIIAIATSGSDTNDSAKITGKINEPVRDGKFEFVVKQVQDNATIDSPLDVAQPPSGKYIKVVITIKNISKKPENFSFNSQYLYDTNDNKSSGSEESFMDKNNSGKAYIDINPGNTITYSLFFDVAKDVKADHLEVHDSAFSGGTSIDLKQ